MNISVSKLKANDLLEQMRFSYCADKRSFVDTFNQIGIPVKSEDDLVKLNDLHNKGFDVTGKIKNSQNKVLKFNIADFVRYNIRLNHSQLVNCNVKFVA